jgi:hypothetical protein
MSVLLQLPTAALRPARKDADMPATVFYAF